MSRPSVLQFRLYVAGNSVNSMQAVANLHALCNEHLIDRHHIEVVDIFKEPLRALSEHILMTPTLIKLAPSPRRIVVGTLSQRSQLLAALGLTASTS